MANSTSVHVIVVRASQRDNAESQWRPVGYLDSLEEADAVLNQLLESERAALQHDSHLGAQEYDVWVVPDAWSVIEHHAS